MNTNSTAQKNISEKVGSYVGIDISDGKGVDLVVDFSEVGIVQKLGWVKNLIQSTVIVCVRTCT